MPAFPGLSARTVGFASAVITATITSSADARHARHFHPAAPVASVQPLRSGAADPYGFYWGGTEVSRDPDPYVRQELQRDYYAIYRW